MQDLMRQKFFEMNQMGDGKQDMMAKMGGKEKMMDMMGMMKGTDKDGKDMKQKFEGAMQKRDQSPGGPMGKEDFMNMKGGKGGKSMKDFAGGCDAS